MNQEKILLVGVHTGNVNNQILELSMEELHELVRTAGGTISGTVIQNRRAIDPKTFIGKGKVEEIKNLLLAVDPPNTVIFNNDLSPTQIRNLEKEWKIKVLTRTELILDIFASHAQSKASKLQVELAQLSYELPHIIGGKGKEMSRLGAGIGTRGPGEKQLELDRRNIEKRISRIKKELEDIDLERAEQRKQRVDKSFKIAIVGYTNSGKSTLLNRITKAGVLVEDKLFATLDTTSRRLFLASESGGISVVLTDTVGFIQDIPHTLIESFKSTLEDTIKADLLIHVLDISTPGYEIKKKIVEETLTEIGAGNIPRILCLNKTDLLSESDNLHMRLDYPDSIPISAKENLNIDFLRETFRKMALTGKEKQNQPDNYYYNKTQ